MDLDIRLTYSGPFNQVRVSFKIDTVRAEKKVPKDLVKRAKAKLEDELGKGHIEAYALYEEGLQAYWDFLRTKDVPQGKNLSFVLAQGYRKLAGLGIRLDGSRKYWLLTLPAKPDVLVKHGWYRVVAQIYAQAALQPHADPMLRCCIWEGLARGMRGLEVKDFPLVHPIAAAGGSGTRLILDKDHGRALLFLYDGQALQETTDLKELLQRIFVHVPKLTEKLASVQVLKRELYEVMKDLQGGPESLGFGLPLCLPLALGAPQKAAVSEKAGQAAPASASAPKRAPAPGSAPSPAQGAKPASAKPAASGGAKAWEQVIRIKILDRGLEARISWSDDDKLANEHYEADRSWLEKALADNKISFGYEPYLNKLLSMITLGQSLRGQVLALGVPPEVGEHPYLHPSYLDRSLGDSTEQVDLRSAQNKLVVDVGDLICEPRYADGKPGTNIFGKTIHAEVPSDVYELEIGNGIDAREDGCCYALIRGVPFIEGNQVSCRQVYVHEGDVNLQSGDIFFDGAVEVRGSIDNGARVYAKGDLIVRGGIGQAKVRCGGDLKVEKGIVSSQEGSVFVEGSAFAQFIENSRLVVQKRLEVAKSLINSDVKVGTELVILGRGKGVIGGGTIVAQGGIVTLDLGFADGEKTKLHVGSDWRMEYRISLLERRDVRIKRYLQERQYEYDELKKRPGADPQKLVRIEGKIFRGKRLSERLLKMMETLSNKLKWSEDVVIAVKGTLDANVDIMIGGRNITLHKSMMEVMVTAVRFRDQYINPLNYIDQYRKMIVDRAS